VPTRERVVDGRRHSENYRGHEILYEPDARSWLVDVGQGERRHRAAFQARRAVNVALDGHSVIWPRRER
jgi:hypothetical protein